MILADSLNFTCARVAQPVIQFERAEELAHAFGTPLLVVSKSKLIETYWSMKNALPGVDLYYAAKSNPDHHILTTLCAENAFVDICSFGELQAALSAGFTVDRMLHTHPCKTDQNLSECYRSGVRWFVFDNVHEAKKIARLASDVKLLLRLAVSASSSLINLSAKFGASIETGLELLQAARHLGLDVRGISFHVGSQCNNPEDYRSVLSAVRGFWDRAAAFGFAMEVLDIGGGFPAPYRSAAPSMEAFGSVVSQGLRESFGDLSVRVVAEPGRGLSAECTTLITRVIGKNHRCDQPWYYLDDGIYGSFSGIVFDHANFPLLVRDAAERGVGSCVVAGPTCDSGDVISRDQLLPELEIDELVLVPSMGAYAGASACPFNGLPVAKSVCIE